MQTYLNLRPPDHKLLLFNYISTIREWLRRKNLKKPTPLRFCLSSSFFEKGMIHASIEPLILTFPTFFSSRSLPLSSAAKASRTWRNSEIKCIDYVTPNDIFCAPLPIELVSHIHHYMTPEIPANAIVADRQIQKLIQGQFGDSIPLIDAESWLSEINQMKHKGNSNVPEILLADVLAVAAFTNGDIPEKLQSLATELHLPFRSFSSKDEASVGSWIVETAFRRTRDAWIDAGQSRKAAAILRQDLEVQQAAFHSLEAAALNFGMPQFTLALDLPLTMGGCINLTGDGCTEEVSTTDKEARGHLTQVLPMSARSIASIELYCEQAPNFPLEGELTVGIYDLAGMLLGATEALDISMLTQGWNRFNLAEGVECTDRDAVLKLSLSGAGAIRVSLGPCVPINRLHPRRIDSTTIGDAPLAIRVWRGFAGVRTPAPLVRVSEGSWVRHHASDLPRPRLHSIEDSKMTFDPVQFWAKEDGFLVHPPSAGMTVAVVENIHVENIASVTAIVNNGHRNGPPISFALGVIPSGEFFHTPDVLGSWLTLPPLGWGEVHAVLQEPASGYFDLVIATMCPKGHENRNAWGLFRGFMLNTKPA